MPKQVREPLDPEAHLRARLRLMDGRYVDDWPRWTVRDNVSVSTLLGELSDLRRRVPALSPDHPDHPWKQAMRDGRFEEGERLREEAERRA